MCQPKKKSQQSKLFLAYKWFSIGIQNIKIFSITLFCENDVPLWLEWERKLSERKGHNHVNIENILFNFTNA